MNSTFLVIALLINGSINPQLLYRVDRKASCEHVAQHAAVQETYQEMFGKDVVLYCVKQQKGER